MCTVQCIFLAVKIFDELDELLLICQNYAYFLENGIIIQA